jgi:carboxymethylenebutenolidase
MLAATRGQECFAARQHTNKEGPMSSFTERVGTEAGNMDLYGALPEEHGPTAGMVVIQHAPGVDRFIRTMVDRLAEAGYAAVAPDLYHRQTEQQLQPLERMKLLQDREVIADVNATVDYMLENPRFDSDRIGIIGFCMGGRVVYLMAAVNPHFKAAVAYYGGNIMVPWGEHVPAPFARTGEIQCPLLFHFGEQDTNPSPQDMRKLGAELTRHGKSHEFYSYADAGHAFMNFTSPERYCERAANTSWSRTLSFLERYLGN